MLEADLLDEDASTGLDLTGDGARVRCLPFASRWSLRADPKDAEELSAAWGAPLPARNLTSTASAGRSALKLGPDEWLLLAGDREAADALTKLVAITAFSLVDISHRNLAFEVSGRQAATVLNAGVPLDLSEAAFPAGRCTRTVLGKAEVMLWRPSAEPGWRVETSRSFADYVARYLAQALADLDAAPAQGVLR